MPDPAPDVTTTRQATFGDLLIAYDDGVLEPRAWTTAQSRWAAELLQDGPEGAVLELCSGAGHIGLLAVAPSSRHLVQVDLDGRACSFARANAAAAGLSAHVEVVEGPVDGAVPAGARFVGVVADPPWVPSTDTGRFPQDPLLAIDGGPDGLDLARTCVEVAGRHLVDGGWLLLQIGTTAQVEALVRWLTLPGSPPLEVRDVRSYDRGVLVLLVRV